MSNRLNIWFLLLLLPCVALCQQKEKRYLSGTGSDDAVNWEFRCTDGMNAGKWTTIPVPSCWELQGFGKYNYGFAKDSARGKEKGLYRHRFAAPAAWKGKVINIVFGGVMTDAEVKVNGKLAGAVHQGAFYAFRYDISRLLRYGGDNLLEVTVAKHSANESVNAAERRGDFWIFGGIFRPVWLEVLPAQHISDVRINALADGTFEASLTAPGADSIVAAVYDAVGTLQGRLSGQQHLKGNFPSAQPWNPETPVLYKVVFDRYKNGKIQHTVYERFGFRTVQLRQRDGIYVNGVKVKMKGVNRHSFRPETGRTLSRLNSIEDVQLIKDMNMNAVRMSHYPPDDHFLDACDSLGLFVMDELAGWHGNYDSITGAKLLQELMAHDRNHPSIIFWANGNEGGHNIALDSLFGAFDPQQRPVVHPWELYNGVETQHYREYQYGIGNYNQGNEIVMPTEFLHGQFDGGHGAGLQDYWEMMWRDPLSAGGFLWDFADQAVVRKDKNDSLDTDKHRGADGIVGPHHEKEGSYFAIKEIWSPVQVTRLGGGGSFTLENRYHYTNLKACKFRWSLKSFAGLAPASGTAPAPDIKPLQNGSLQLDLPGNWYHYDVVSLQVIDHTDRELFTHTWPISRPAEVTQRMITTAGAKSIEVKEADSLLHVTANNIRLSFHLGNGGLTNISNERGPIPLSNGPLLQDGENHFSKLTYHREDSTLVVESTFDRAKAYNTIRWTIYPSGLLKMELRYFPEAYFTFFSGINFHFPEKMMRSVKYMGDGPYRVWKNRMKGQQFGVWEKTYNNTETGEYPWVYPEFKGYHAHLYWAQFNMDGNHFRVFTDTENLFLRLFTPAWKTDQWHNYEPLFPAGDISFLQGISSIGTKTQRNETTGPMGQRYGFYDYEKEPARALKMILYFDFSGK
ncbi:glycoside hydrolase family 2 [Chitinophaga horti]|uniref:beta-galactosidase n=1 Tax=Chitinophaga horti TaxID=2920382 RepID=A0ABY6JAF2_9BACT|nr:glycoside hydrolase family 2 TIM barrel-domain containing protein [Chitinophaga horti]UYQ95542.1 glycoside hydrolase family 2 [Chitinophaga horti]